MDYYNLWKKGENCANAQYINIFDLTESELNKSPYRVTERKKNSVSSGKNRDAESKIRQAGLNTNIWNDALEACNTSLRFADIGSEQFLVAISNRSECFLNLNMFTNCMIDIDLVMNGNCSKQMLTILEERRKKCTQMMLLMEELNLLKPKLSFNANPRIPFFANCLEIKHSNQFGYHVVANSDIDVGKTVVVEESFSSCTLSGRLTGCATCQKTRMNFIPCDKCSTVLFCDETCKSKNLFHIHECGIMADNLDSAKLIAQTILMVMSNFHSVENLMEFVEQTNNVGSAMPESILDEKSKYRMFLKLHANFPDHSIPTDYVIQAKKTFLHMVRLPVIKTFFAEESQRRFLMHLVLQHTIIVKKNGFTYMQNKIQKISIVNTVSSLFNHSCAPNLLNIGTDADQLCITLRPIKKGEQLFVTYAINNDLPTVLRQYALLRTFGFDCQCEKCVPRSSSSDRELIKSNKYYKYMIANRDKDFLDEKTRSVLKQICERFLNECGRLPWCPEMEFIMEIYSMYHRYDY